MIGRLFARVTLLEPVTTDDGVGGGAITYVDRAKAWAWAKTTSRGRDDERAHDLVGLTRPVLRVRHRGDVAAGWRVTRGDQTLRVRAVRDPDGRRRWLDLDCEEERA